MLNSQVNSALAIAPGNRAQGGNVCTWKCDVEALVGDGEIRDEAQLGLEIAIKACIDGRRQLGTCEASKRLHKTSILCYKQIVVVVLQMEGVKVELNSCCEKKNEPTRMSDIQEWSKKPVIFKKIYLFNLLDLLKRL